MLRKTGDLILMTILMPFIIVGFGFVMLLGLLDEVGSQIFK
jgi:hypothetical protein